MGGGGLRRVYARNLRAYVPRLVDEPVADCLRHLGGVKGGGVGVGARGIGVRAALESCSNYNANKNSLNI